MRKNKRLVERRLLGATSLSLMTILAWNYLGLRSALAVQTLADKVRSKDPLLIFLAETKIREGK